MPEDESIKYQKDLSSELFDEITSFLPTDKIYLLGRLLEIERKLTIESLRRGDKS
jgi:hypothetical protein